MSERRNTGGSERGPPAKKPLLATSGLSSSPNVASGFSSPGPNRAEFRTPSPNVGAPAFTSTPNAKKVSAEWYRDYEKKSFIHDTSHEFEATKIHTQSYDHRIGHIRGSFLITNIYNFERYNFANFTIWKYLLMTFNIF